MNPKLKFSEKVSERIGYYVYRLIDPRNGTTFYVGRGRGNRVFEHAAGAYVSEDDAVQGNENDPLKLKTIWAIRKAGLDVVHLIHRHGMDGSSAAEVESALIDAYPGLTNLVKGQDADRGVMHAQQIIAEYDAPTAEPHHKLLVINVNRTSDTESLYDAVRYAWKIDPKKAAEADYVLAVIRGLIAGAFKADKWLPADAVEFAHFSRDSFGPREGRYGFVGRDAPIEVKALYEQKRLPDELRKKGAANPIRYWNI